MERGRSQAPATIATLPGSDLRHLNPSLRGQAFSPGDQILATAYYDQVVLWDVTSPVRPRLLRTLDAQATSPAGNSDEVPFSPQDLAFSSDGDILASATGTDQVTLWNVTDPAHAYRTADLDSPGVFTQGLAFSPSGNLLAVLTSHGTVLVYSLADPARPARTATATGLLARAKYPDGQSQPDEVLCASCGFTSEAVAFSPDGHTLTVVVDRTEMSANSGRDTIFDWHVTGAGTLGAGTAAARDVADSQPSATAPCWAARVTATPGTPGRCPDLPQLDACLPPPIRAQNRMTCMGLRAHPTQPPAVSDSAGAMRGALTFAARDMNRVGMTATAARWVLRRGCQTGKSLLVRPQPGVL